MVKILLVDDTIYFGTEISNQLRDMGYQVEYLTNGSGIKESIRRFNPLVVFLDIDLGIHQSGIEICEMLTKETPNLPVILISSHVDSETRERGIRAGAKAFVGKPLTASLLEAYVRLFAPGAGADTPLKELYPDLVTLSDLKVSFKKRLLFYPNNEAEQLAPIVSSLLELLYNNVGKVVSMGEIIENQWGEYEPINAPASVYTAISMLRMLLINDVKIRLRTIRGQGYSLELQP